MISVLLFLMFLKQTTFVHNGFTAVMINGMVASHPSVYEKVGQMLRVPSGPSDLYVKVALLGAGMGEIISTPSSLVVLALANRSLDI